MPIVRLVTATACALWLSACAGGVNLYAEPTAQFENAVAVTAQVVDNYAAIERRLLKTGAVDNLALDPASRLSFQPTECKIGNPGAGCAIQNRATHKPVITQFDGGGAATGGGSQAIVDMMDKVQAYAGLLASIAQAENEADLKLRAERGEQAYSKLYASVKALRGGDTGGGVGDLKSAFADGLAALYVENKRLKLMRALVEHGDPVIQAVGSTLGSFVSDIQTDFVANEKDRIQNLVLTYNVLGGQATGANATDVAIMRRELLNRAVQEQAILQVVMSSDARDAFTQMQAAHTALKDALIQADSVTGKAQVAIANALAASERFMSAAQKASSVMANLNGMI